MARGTDFLIVGGGCIGASAAYHLAVRGAGMVTLLERQTLGAGTTGQSSAIVRQHYGTPVLAEMARRCLHVFEDAAEELGTEVGFSKTGLLIGARQSDLAALRQSVAMQQDLGIETQLIDRDELRALEPRMATDDLVGACYEPGAGYADPVATTIAYAQLARELGATIRQRAAVQSLLLDGAAVRGVRLADGETITAGAVLVAAGIWGLPLLRQAGVELPIHATRHPCVLLQRPPDFGPRHAILFDFTNGLYLKPEGTDLTLAGTLDEDEVDAVDPDRYNTRTTGDERERLAERTAVRFPALAEATLQSGWSGLYDVSADWQPAIGAVPGVEGLYCALGFSGHGFKLCPVVGQLIADQLLNTDTLALDTSLFRPDRFTSGALAESRYQYGIIG